LDHSTDLIRSTIARIERADHSMMQCDESTDYEQQMQFMQAEKRNEECDERD
jgi:hypothetical protein